MSAVDYFALVAVTVEFTDAVFWIHELLRFDCGFEVFGERGWYLFAIPADSW
jgi:hypothetical protein